MIHYDPIQRRLASIPEYRDYVWTGLHTFHNSKVDYYSTAAGLIEFTEPATNTNVLQIVAENAGYAGLLSKALNFELLTQSDYTGGAGNKSAYVFLNQSVFGSARLGGVYVGGGIATVECFGTSTNGYIECLSTFGAGASTVTLAPTASTFKNTGTDFSSSSGTVLNLNDSGAVARLQLVVNSSSASALLAKTGSLQVATYSNYALPAGSTFGSLDLGQGFSGTAALRGAYTGGGTGQIYISGSSTDSTLAITTVFGGNTQTLGVSTLSAYMYWRYNATDQFRVDNTGVGSLVDGSGALSQIATYKSAPTWTGLHTFTAGIVNYSTTAATQFSTGYSSTNGITFATTSAGTTTVTQNVSAPSASTQLFTIQPVSGTGLLTNGASTFQVNDIALRQRFWIGRVGAGAAATAVRIGFDNANYLQISGGTAAASTTSFTVVGSTGITFTPTTIHTGLATFNGGATVADGQTLTAALYDSNTAAAANGMTIGPTIARSSSIYKEIIFRNSVGNMAWFNTSGNLVFTSGFGIFAAQGSDQSTYTGATNAFTNAFNGSVTTDKQIVYIQASQGNTNAASNILTGVLLKANFNSGSASASIGSVVGGTFEAAVETYNSSQTATNVIAGEFKVSTYAFAPVTGMTITSAVGCLAWAPQLAGINTTFTAMTLFLAKNPVSGGSMGAGTTITSLYGSRIEEMTKGTSNYGLWLDAASASYKAIVIGSTSSYLAWESAGVVSINATTLQMKAALDISTKDVVTDTGTGTKIGTATGQKIAFHNSTPVIQRAGAAQAAASTTGATNITPYGYTTAAQADAIVALVNELRAAMVEKGLIKGSA